MKLSLQDVTVSIANNVICDGFSQTFNSGECWAILGRNGVGKTTLLHSMAGLRDVDRGQVCLNDENLASCSRRHVAQQISILLQEAETLFPSSVLEAVLVGRHPYQSRWAVPSAEDNACALKALEDVGLADYATRDFSTLSGGEKRRVELAALICQSTPIVMLDEPVNHLDLRHQIQTLRYFSQSAKNNNKLVFIVLHDVNLALRFCDHALLMMGDKQMISGRADSIINADNLSQLYQTTIKQVENYFVAD